MTTKASVTDLMTPGHIFMWFVFGCFFPPWFLIHPLLLFVIYHKRSNPGAPKAPHEIYSYNGPIQLEKPFLPIHTFKAKEPEPIPQSHWDSINAFKEKKRQENQNRPKHRHYALNAPIVEELENEFTQIGTDQKPEEN